MWQMLLIYLYVYHLIQNVFIGDSLRPCTMLTIGENQAKQTGMVTTSWSLQSNKRDNNE